MKKLFLLLFLTYGCGSSPVAESKGNGIKFNKPFLIDSIEFNMFDLTKTSVMLVSNKIAPQLTLKKVIDTIAYTEKNYFFYYDEFKESGEDYASYINNSLFLIEKPITNKVQSAIGKCTILISSINAQMEALEFTKDNRKVVTNVIIDDLKKLDTHIGNAKSCINDLNKNIYDEEVAQLNQISKTYNKLSKKLKGIPSK